MHEILPALLYMYVHVVMLKFRNIPTFKGVAIKLL